MILSITMPHIKKQLIYHTCICEVYYGDYNYLDMLKVWSQPVQIREVRTLNVHAGLVLINQEIHA